MPRQTFDAFEMSPVPAPGSDAVTPEPFRGIYGMPSFVTIPSADLAASSEFWTRGLQFFELFTIVGQLLHLRRWAFQDVLLVPSTTVSERPSELTVSFACVLSQIEEIQTSCRALDAGSVGEPRDTPWNTRDLEIVTPERTRVVFTAAKPFDPTSAAGQHLADVGIAPPDGSSPESS